MPHETSLRRQWRRLAIGACLVMAAYLWLWYSPELAEVQRWAEQASHHPLTVVGVILLMAVTLTLGLPGSIGLWLIAPFYPPMAAIPMLTLGSVLGAIGAYRLSARMGGFCKAGRLTHRVSRMLDNHHDLLTQCALRVLPGFPHSVINYVAGWQRLPLGNFVLAAILGLGVKWAVYASTIHGALEAIEEEGTFGMGVLMPLVALTLLLLIGAWMRRRLDPGRERLID
jgi:uncharacterized membrane protein YdjX (TVP38/TMEM64 family)